MFSLFPLSLLDLKNACLVDRSERPITQQFLWLRFYADIFNRVFITGGNHGTESFGKA